MSHMRDGLPNSPFRVVAAVAGLALVGSYLLAWVKVSPPDGPEATVAASEIVILPKLVAALGVVALGLALARWTRATQLAVVGLGIVGAGISLYMREFLNSGDTIIEVGEYLGRASNFDPAVGMNAALVASLLLVGAGFAAFLRSLDDSPASDTPGSEERD
jgi:hypothetical protein